MELCLANLCLFQIDKSVQMRALLQDLILQMSVLARFFGNESQYFAD